jgi:hypothetical protein
MTSDRNIVTVTRELADAAYDLAVEIHEGDWKHVKCLDLKPAPACPEIIDALRKRCPGYSVEQYQRALADGLFASMK